MAGREVGDDVIVKVLIRGEAVLANAKVLRLAEQVSQAHLVAVAQSVDLQAQLEQQLTAGDITFLAMFVRGDCMFRDGRTASQVTGIEAMMETPAPQVTSDTLWPPFRLPSTEGLFLQRVQKIHLQRAGARRLLLCVYKH